MLEVIKLGSDPEELKGSYDVWLGLVQDLKTICSEL
jgi:hypothetical protein